MTVQDPRVLVTGATGNVGSVVVQLLADADVSVRAMTRRPEGTDLNSDQNIEVVSGDFLQPESLNAALQGVDKAFLLSPNVKEMAEMQSNFLAAAVRADIDHLVKLSAAGADPDTSWDIARWHGQIEMEIEASGLDYTFIRPVSYMQNLLNDTETIRSKGYFARTTSPTANINVVDTRDVARLVAAVLYDDQHRGAVYKPTGPEPISFKAMAQMLSDATDHDVAFQEMAPPEARQSLIADGNPEWLADAMVGLQVAFGNGIADLNTDDIERVTGEPPRDFATFAEDFAELFTPN